VINSNKSHAIASQLHNDTLPITEIPNTCPNWLRSILPLETPFEKADRIEREFKAIDVAKAAAEQVYNDRIEHLNDRELFLMDQRRLVLEELEAMGEEV